MASDGQDLTDNAPSLHPQSFCRCTCLLDTVQPCLRLFALSIPRSLFSLDCLSLINLMLNLETYFSKSKGLERERSKDENGFSNSCLSSFIYLFDEREVVPKISLCLSSLCSRRNFFPVLQLNVTGRIVVSRGPHLNRQREQLTSFSSEGLRFIKLRLVEIQMEYYGR